MSEQLSIDGVVPDARFRVEEMRGFLQACFGARCARCGAWLTKWDFSAEDAASGAAHELDRQDGRAHRCGARFRSAP